MKKNLVIINFFTINIILLYIYLYFNGLPLILQKLHLIEMHLISNTLYYWIEYLQNLIGMFINTINFYLNLHLKIQIIDIWFQYLELFNFIQTILLNLKLNVLTILCDKFFNINYFNITSFFFNELLSLLKIKLIYLISSLYFYIQIKIVIKFWIISKFIIKLIKKKITFKLLSYFNKMFSPLSLNGWDGRTEYLMKCSSKIFNYIKINSILKYFIILFIFFISFITPLSLDYNFLSFFIVVFIRYWFKNLLHSITILSVIPLAISEENKQEDYAPLRTPIKGGEDFDAYFEECSAEQEDYVEEECSAEQEDYAPSGEDFEDNNNNLESEDDNIETINFTNFNNLSHQEKQKYVESKIKLKGLTSNIYLIEYFINCILSKATSHSISQLEVENFLNKDLNILLKDKRNIQLNNHSFTRIKPFLLNNSNNSGFPSVVPYKSDKSDNSIELD